MNCVWAWVKTQYATAESTLNTMGGAPVITAIKTTDGCRWSRFDTDVKLESNRLLSVRGNLNYRCSSITGKGDTIMDASVAAEMEASAQALLFGIFGRRGASALVRLPYEYRDYATTYSEPGGGTILTLFRATDTSTFTEEAVKGGLMPEWTPIASHTFPAGETSGILEITLPSACPLLAVLETAFPVGKEIETVGAIDWDVGPANWNPAILRRISSHASLRLNFADIKAKTPGRKAGGKGLHCQA